MATSQTMAAPTGNGTNKLDPKVVRTALAIMAGGVAVVFDTTIVNVALNDLARDLHTPLPRHPGKPFGPGRTSRGDQHVVLLLRGRLHDTADESELHVGVMAAGRARRKDQRQRARTAIGQSTRRGVRLETEILDHPLDPVPARLTSPFSPKAIRRGRPRAC